MTTIIEVIVYSYAQTAAAIRKLKTDAYKSTTQEKYAYQAPDGKSYRNKRPSQPALKSVSLPGGSFNCGRIMSFLAYRINGG